MALPNLSSSLQSERQRQKVLFVVPHPDDEFLIGGGLLFFLKDKLHCEIHVLITTNGDNILGQAGIRCMESVNALFQVVDIPKKNIHFLGFGNDWKGDHIYHSAPAERCTSFCGRNASYVPFVSRSKCIAGLFACTGVPYTRNNYRNAVKETIKQLLPDTVICIGYDSHPDHRALSLLCEESMAELMREMDGYHPLYLTKFAYCGILNGPNDFYARPPQLTECPVDIPFFTEDNAIRYAQPPNCSTRFLANNPLFKLAKKYRSQRLRERAGRIINADNVYWQRQTDNLALRSQITVSSGDARYINDFKLLETQDITSNRPRFLGWEPAESDKNKAIKIQLKKGHPITHVAIYVLKSAENNSVRITASGRNVEAPIETNQIIKIDFVQPVVSNYIVFQFHRSVSIGEIEVLEKEQEKPFSSLILGKLSTKQVKQSIILANISALFNEIAGQFDRLINILRRKRMCRKERSKGVYQ